MTGDWRELHNEEFCNLRNVNRIMKLRRLRCAGNVAHMARCRMDIGQLTGKTEVKGPRGRPRSKWDVNNERDFGDTGWGWYGLD